LPTYYVKALVGVGLVCLFSHFGFLIPDVFGNLGELVSVLSNLVG